MRALSGSIRVEDRFYQRGTATIDLENGQVSGDGHLIEPIKRIGGDGRFPSEFVYNVAPTAFVVGTIRAFFNVTAAPTDRLLTIRWDCSDVADRPDGLPSEIRELSFLIVGRETA